MSEVVISSVVGKSFSHLYASARVVEEMILSDATYWNEDTGFPFRADLGGDYLGDGWNASKVLLGCTWSRRVEFHEQDVSVIHGHLGFGHVFAILF